MAGLNECCMTSEQRCNLVLAFARVLYVNGQATDQTAAAAERIRTNLGTACQDHPALGRPAARIRRRWRWSDPASGGRSDGRPHGSCGFRDAGDRGCRSRSAHAERRIDGDRRNLAGAASSHMALRARSRGRRGGAGSDLRRRASRSRDFDIRQRRRGRHFAPRIGAVERERLCPTGLRGDSRRRHRRRRVSLSVELFTAPCCDLPMHGLGSGATRTQRRDGPHPGRHPFGRRASDLCNVGHRGDLDGTAVRTGPSRSSRSRSTNSAGPFRYGRT